MTREIPTTPNLNFSPGEPRTERAEDILRWAEKHGYSVELGGRDIQVIVLGEHHTAPEHAAAQAELVRLVSPSIILAEGLWAGYYDPSYDELTYDRKEFFNRAQVGKTNLGAILDVAHELGIYMLGCDLKGYDFWEKILETTTDDRIRKIASMVLDGLVDSSLENYGLKMISMTDVGNRVRNDHMVKKILEVIAESSQPIIVIVGGKHAESFRTLLRSRGIGFAIVSQHQ